MNVLAMILAGGEGRRLYPLTAKRSKPAVPFGGRYRIIDFPLSNFVNSGITKIKVLTQFMSDSLIRHLDRGWRLSPAIDQYIDPVPAQMRTGRDWYRGTADAIYQNLHIVEREKVDYVCVFGGDHIYRMDIEQMLNYHIEKKADMTVSAIPFAREKSSAFGVLQVSADFRIVDFEEKPDNPVPIPGQEDMSLVSMGNYIFNRDALIDMVRTDAGRDSAHDFGRDIIPSSINGYGVYAYDFSTNQAPGVSEEERGYWRDVGDLDQYWEASLDLVSVSPVFNLYNSSWPIRSFHTPAPPAKFVFADIGRRAGLATDSLVSEGCVISGGRVNRCVLSPDCRINSFANVEESVLMEGVEVGRHSRIRRAIIDKRVVIPPGTEIGYDLDEDRRRFHVTAGGVVVVPKEAEIAEPSLA